MEKNRIFDWLLRFIKGGVMGMDFVLPGISGAALAVVFGLYERIVRFIAHITTDFVKNVFFFIPVGCGVLIGIYIVSHPMSFLLENYITPVLWFFVGAILGTMPDLWRKSGEKGRKTLHIGMLAGTFAIATPLFVIMAGSESFGNLQVNTWTAFGAGAMVAFVAFIPGFSSSTFLVMLGLYRDLIDSCKALELPVLIPFGLGLLIFAFPFSRLIEFLLKRVFTGFFHIIIGFVLASAVLVAVKASEGYNYLQIGTAACVATFVAGAMFSYWMCNVSKKYGV